MATPELLAAVSAAVKGEAPPAQDAPVADPPAADPPAEAVADPPAATAADLIGDPPADPAEPAADAQGRVRGPDGKFVAKVADPDPDTGAAAKPAAAVLPVAAAAPAALVLPPDHLNDPIPENAKPATKERMQSLVGMVKERDTEITTVRGDLDMLLAPINEAGASVEQFRESMQLLKYINSPHPHEQMQALQYLQGAGSQLAERLGHVPPGTDPLAGNPDLMQMVQQNPAMRSVLEETARSRRLVAANNQHQQTSLQRSQQEQTRQREQQEGQDAVRAVEQGFEEVDAQYKAKIAVLRADTAFVNSLRSVPPKQWAAKFAEKYRSIKVAVSPVAAASAATPAVPSPLRTKQPAGTAAKPPGSVLDAVRGSLSQLRAG